ncbi:HNH endonuclease [Bacillus wiedmannii]
MAMNTICKHGKVIPMGTKCKCKTRTAPSIKRESSEVDKLRNSDRWKRKTRPRIINRDDGLCQRCLIKYNIINSDDLQIHHIKSAVNHIELFFLDSNLITLCKTCNLQLGTKDELDFDYETPEEYEYSL